MFLERLLEVNAQAKVTVVEQSEQMMKRAKRRVAEKDIRRVISGNSPLRSSIPPSVSTLCALFFGIVSPKVRSGPCYPCWNATVRGPLWLGVDFFENPHGSTRTGIWHYLLIVSYTVSLVLQLGLKRDES